MRVAVKDIKVKPGYKRTEVGMIPEDWEVDNLKRFWAVIDCKHLTAKFVGNGIPLASIREVQSHFIELENAKQTTQLYYLALIEGGRKPQPSDLIFSRNATVGEIAQVTEWHPPFAMGQDVCLLRKKHSGFSSDYLQAVVRSPMVIKQLTNFMVGSTFKRVNVEQIRNLIMPMPSPEEQTAIATILYDTDSLIESLDKLIAKKRDIKQATMQQLLTGKKRLPRFSGELKPAYKQTEIGMIPEDWEVKTVEEIANVRGGKRLPAGKALSNSPTPYPYIRITDMFYGGVSLDEINYVPIEVFPSIKNYRIYKDDIFVTVAGTLGIVGKVPPELNGANLTENADKITNINCDGNYLLYTLMSPRIQRAIKSEETVSAQPKLALNRIEKFRIALPTNKAEQQAIAIILSDMDAEIVALELKRDKTRALKQGMMQELLTGKTRLI